VLYQLSYCGFAQGRPMNVERRRPRKGPLYVSFKSVARAPIATTSMAAS
jgi:hypothetical protein